jgi:hypothetical protein
MKENKIDEDEIDWLICVYKTVEVDELKKDSLEKLTNHGLDEKQIDERYTKIRDEKNEIKAFDKSWARQLQRNQFESYTVYEKLKIFFFGPYSLFRQFDSGLVELKEGNYTIKFRQRLVLLVLGICFWILLFVFSFQYFEHQRLQEIEEIELQDSYE